MAENTKIEWATHTFNTHWGCTKVSEGCKHCYAETLSERFGNNVWGPTASRKPMSEAYWGQLDKWQRKAEKGSTEAERHPRIFCNSMSDLFEGPETCQNPEAYQVVQDARARLFAAIERSPNLQCLLLSKRPENMIKFAPEAWASGWPKNAMAGTSVEDQKAADKRVPDILAVPARRFLSVEPLLAAVDLSKFLSCPDCGHARNIHAERSRIVGCTYGDGSDESPICGCRNMQEQEVPPLHWVIVGGESGPGARPMLSDWARRLRDQCGGEGVPFLFKQWGNWLPVNSVEEARQYPSAAMHDWSDDLRSLNVGKHAAGRLLDGRTWDEVPEVTR